VLERLEPRLALSGTANFGAPALDGPTPPFVVSGLRSGIHAQPTEIVITFNQPMNVASVQDVNNYILLGQRSGRTPFVSAIYDPATQSVTLHPRRRIKLHFDFFLQIRAQGPHPVSNAAGIALDGSYSGNAGIDFTALIRGFSVTSSIPNNQPTAPAPTASSARLSALRSASTSPGLTTLHLAPALRHHHAAS
jgi:hypothetical protein